MNMHKMKMLFIANLKTSYETPPKNLKFTFRYLTKPLEKSVKPHIFPVTHHFTIPPLSFSECV